MSDVSKPLTKQANAIRYFFFAYSYIIRAAQGDLVRLIVTARKVHSMFATQVALMVIRSALAIELQLALGNVHVQPYPRTDHALQKSLQKRIHIVIAAERGSPTDRPRSSQSR